MTHKLLVLFLLVVTILPVTMIADSFLGFLAVLVLGCLSCSPKIQDWIVR